ncbi:hypothetical protein BOTBODRAFT_145792 [Botryobasidium botryosum FD-172 SS1]|uniref:F-box domain-containing protein n=1 Tax=Botryobasidium botryosum (strain FD-172 SS1) TaxID=930990 RepID=A0A067MRD7_BOTB1|nr:hypothetical protein BOTBODRAFT_145792 [Botryobasidium botryosum FD-172 SS1]
MEVVRENKNSTRVSIGLEGRDRERELTALEAPPMASEGNALGSSRSVGICGPLRGRDAAGLDPKLLRDASRHMVVKNRKGAQAWLEANERRLVLPIGRVDARNNTRGLLALVACSGSRDFIPTVYLPAKQQGARIGDPVLYHSAHCAFPSSFGGLTTLEYPAPSLVRTSAILLCNQRQSPPKSRPCLASGRNPSAHLTSLLPLAQSTHPTCLYAAISPSLNQAKLSIRSDHICDKLAKSRLMMAQLTTSRAHAYPVPWEVLTEIFIACVEGNDTNPVVLSSVCKAWRSRARALSRLWFRLSVNLSAGHEALRKAQFWLHQWAPTKGRRRFPLLEVKIYRSSREILSHSKNTRYINSLASLICNHNRYWGQLAISLSPHDAHTFFQACSDVATPSLNCVSITLLPTSNALHIPILLGVGESMMSTTTLSLSNNSIRFKPNFSAAITDLDFTFGPEYTSDHLRYHLHGCSNLAVLRLAAAPGGASDPPKTVAPVLPHHFPAIVALPSVHTLTISSLQSLRGIHSCLSFPSIQSFSALKFEWEKSNVIALIEMFGRASGSLKEIAVTGKRSHLPPHDEPALPLFLPHVTCLRGANPGFLQLIRCLRLPGLQVLQLSDILPETATQALAHSPAVKDVDFSAITRVHTYVPIQIFQHDVVTTLRLSSSCLGWALGCRFPSLRSLSLWSEQSRSHPKVGETLAWIAAYSPLLLTVRLESMDVSGEMFVRCMQMMMDCVQTVEFVGCSYVNCAVRRMEDPDVLPSLTRLLIRDCKLVTPRAVIDSLRIRRTGTGPETETETETETASAAPDFELGGEVVFSKGCIVSPEEKLALEADMDGLEGVLVFIRA